MKWLWAVVLVMLLVSTAHAIPATGAATLVSSNNATLAAAGVTAPVWFEYGMTSGSLIWRTQNETAAGAYSKRVYGSPLMAGQKFYYRVCDSTGCGAELSFTLLAATPQPTTTFGNAYRNVTEAGFDPAIIALNAMSPYMWPVAPQSIVYGLIFLFIFAGMWVRGRDVTIPTVLGLIVGFVILNPAYGVAVPVEFLGISQGIAYASLAGIIFALFKK